jgi:hypothetical protein
MHRLFFDTNVLLDVLEQRSPWFPESAECLALARHGTCSGAITALSLSDIAYIQRATPSGKVYDTFQTLRAFLDIAPLSAASIDASLIRRLPDMEDGFQWEAALFWKATHFITRNVKDFPRSDSLVVQRPSEYLLTR